MRQKYFTYSQILGEESERLLLRLKSFLGTQSDISLDELNSEIKKIDDLLILLQYDEHSDTNGSIVVSGGTY